MKRPTLPRIPWYWHVLIVIVVTVVLTAVAIWFDLGHAVHSMASVAA